MLLSHFVKQRAFLLLVASGLVTSSCTHPPPPVTETELLGTWRNVDQELEGPSTFPANQVIIRRAKYGLDFHSERGFEESNLTTGGDSLSMWKGCFVYKRAVSFQKAQLGSQDTLFVESFGKYTRVDTATFFTAWRVRAAMHKERQRLFELRHSRAGADTAIAGQR